MNDDQDSGRGESEDGEDITYEFTDAQLLVSALWENGLLHLRKDNDEYSVRYVAYEGNGKTTIAIGEKLEMRL